MIILGTIDGRQYGIEYNGQFIYGEVNEYKEDQTNKKGVVINCKGDKYLTSAKYPSTIGYAIEMFVKQYQGYKIASLNDGKLQDLIDIFNESNEIRNQLLEKLK